MHELSIAQALVEQLESLAAREGAARVLRVNVTIGSLSGVDPEALTLAYPMAAEGTVAQDSSLEIRQVPARLRCRDCRRETVTDDPVLLCGCCGSGNVELTAGRELHLASAEVEQTPR